jgi:hypothetical protein
MSLRALATKTIDSDEDLMGYIMSCATGISGEPDVKGRIYLEGLCRRLIDEIRSAPHVSKSAFSVSIFGRDGMSAIYNCVSVGHMHHVVALAVVLVCSTALPVFAAHLRRTSRPESIEQILQFVANGFHTLLVGSRADGEKPRDPKGADVAFPTLEHLICEVRFRYFARWDPDGAFRAAAGLPPMWDSPPGARFAPPAWSDVVEGMSLPHH